MHQHLVGMLNAVLRGDRWQRQLRLQPEGIILTHRQNQHGFQGPVGRTRRIVILRHNQIRVAIAHAQHAITIEQRLLQPPAEMAQGGDARALVALFNKLAIGEVRDNHARAP